MTRIDANDSQTQRQNCLIKLGFSDRVPAILDVIEASPDVTGMMATKTE